MYTFKTYVTLPLPLVDSNMDIVGRLNVMHEQVFKVCS